MQKKKALYSIKFFMGINGHFEGIKTINQAKKMKLFYKIYQFKMLLKP